MSNPFGIVETSELSTNANKEILTSKAFENFGRVENTCIKLDTFLLNKGADCGQPLYL